MENNESSLFELQIDQPIIGYLMDSAKWARFLAIIGFVSCGILILVGIYYSTRLFSMNGYTIEDTIGEITVVVIYIVWAVLYFFPCLFILRFANKMQTALRNNDQIQLSESFKNMKACYKFMGITAIIGLSFIVIGIITAIVLDGMRQL